MKRVVKPVKGHADEVKRMVAALQPGCAAGFFFLLDELSRLDPDPDEDCGELDGRYSVYAANIPGCGTWRFVTSILHKGATACYVHGVVPAGKEQCLSAYRLASRQLSLSSKPWDPRR